MTLNNHIMKFYLLGLGIGSFINYKFPIFHMKIDNISSYLIGLGIGLFFGKSFIKYNFNIDYNYTHTQYLRNI